MKLNYYLLWVEDDDSWFKDTSELFEMTIKDFGFDAIIERKKTLLEVKEEIAKDNLKKFDIFLIDFNLKDSASGDNIIELLRGKEIYTDIVFYSSDKGSIIESVKEHQFEGVYHSDRKEIEDKFVKVFKTTIKKIEEINSMRGLIVGETSELDALIEEHLIFYSQSKFIEKFNLAKFIEIEIVKIIEKRSVKIDELYKSEGLISIIPHIDVAKKWQLLRGILKVNTDYKPYITEFLTINSKYQDDVIQIRNKFAHAKVITKDNGKEVLKAFIGDDHFEFDEESFKKIREDLITHRNALIKLQQ